MKDSRYLQFQATLKHEAQSLADVEGYDRLISSIEDVADWDGFQAILIQITTTRWFKDKGILKELEPSLPHRVGYADILVSFSQQDIYCEVTSLESLVKSIESRDQSAYDNTIVTRLRRLPYLTQEEKEHQIQLYNHGATIPEREEIEHQIQSEKILTTLLKKTSKQLPERYPGIIALETGKAAVFHQQVQEIAKKLFSRRSHVMLLMLWSFERGSMIGEPPFWFSNPVSEYQAVAKNLREFLGT